MKWKGIVLLALVVLASILFFVMKQRRSQADQSRSVVISPDGQIVASPPAGAAPTIVAHFPQGTNSSAMPKSGPNAK
jgi:hypothetical protein